LLGDDDALEELLGAKASIEELLEEVKSATGPSSESSDEQAARAKMPAAKNGKIFFTESLTVNGTISSKTVRSIFNIAVRDTLTRTFASIATTATNFITPSAIDFAIFLISACPCAAKRATCVNTSTLSNIRNTTSRKSARANRIDVGIRTRTIIYIVRIATENAVCGAAEQKRSC
jgi:hypothetical protein